MKLQIIGEDMQPLEVDARRVLVLMDDGTTPVAVAAQYMGVEVCVSHFGDPNFNETLARLGIRARVRVETLAPLVLGQRSLLE